MGGLFFGTPGRLISFLQSLGKSELHLEYLQGLGSVLGATDGNSNAGTDRAEFHQKYHPALYSVLSMLTSKDVLDQ